jgi:hypothetical protein
MSTKIPDSFICPITNSVMKDPVIDSDGNSYERVAIMEWVARTRTSPITRNILLPHQLFPNRALKDMIETFLRENPDAVENTVAESKNATIDTVMDKTSKLDLNVGDSKDGATGPASPSNTQPTHFRDEAKGEPTAATAVLNDVDNDSKEPPLDRKPIILVPIIDVSGSMQEPCGTGHQLEDDGYSRLDLVKHTLNTLLTSLSTYDYVCIVKFSTVAEVFAPLTRLTPNNKRVLMEKLKYLEPENQTNLWDGVRLAIEEISGLNDALDRFNVQMYLLTDGEPNISPPGSLPEVIKQHLNRKFPRLKPVINTFGYGYNLDSDMLFHISRAVPGGIFGFLPDATMVGTVFINALSNTIAGEKPVLHGVAEAVCTELVNTLFNIISARDPNNREMLLNRFVDYLRVAKLAAQREQADQLTFDFLEDLKIDCSESDEANKGQIQKATLDRYFSTWGKHYLRSIISSFHNRVCINFKDYAMQKFRTVKFVEEQKRIESIFIQLPPPKPSNTVRRANNSGRGGANYGTGFPGGGGGGGGDRDADYYNNQGAQGYVSPTPGDMSEYIDPNGGCFSGESLFLSCCGQDNQQMSVKEMKKGMKVLSLDGITTVEAIVKIKYSGRLYEVDHMQFTPYHPILYTDGREYFPCQCPSAKQLSESVDGYVYDVVLANRSLLATPGQEGSFYVATFGHTRKSPVFSHDYFGTERIVEDLKMTKQWREGNQEEEVMIMEKPEYQRNQNTGLIERVIWN